MTIDARRILLALPVVAAAWIAILAGVTRLSGDAPQALVLWPPAALLAGLPGGVSVTGTGRHSMTFRGGPDLVAVLYAGGAWLVLPAGLTGCLPQS